MLKKPTLLESRHMGRRIYLWQYGHFGAPVLVFPSAAGMAHEWESHGMVDALSGLALAPLPAFNRCHRLVVGAELFEVSASAKGIQVSLNNCQLTLTG